jgi:quinol-cytochrome oxidoreductase complex cytochrome b subunit
MFGFLIGGLVILHIIILHYLSSSSPTINNMSSLLIPFAIFFFKDFFSALLMCSSVLFIEPDILGNVSNLILANSLTTPLNIIPE